MSHSSILRHLALEQDTDLAIIAMSYKLLQLKKHKKRKHRWWVHKILRKRAQQGAFYNLVSELQLDVEKFQQYFRLTGEQFKQVLFHVEKDLVKRSLCRKVICPRERLAICLRFLATGETFRSIAFSYRVGATTVGTIVSECCRVLRDKLAPIYMKMPQDSEAWRIIAANFDDKWQFPHCLGALDGKHVVMTAPWNSGSLYFNYKGTFSTVLLAMVDVNLRFISIDVGAYGRNSDEGIFSNSNLGKAIAKDALHFPVAEPIPGVEHLGNMPYVVVADEAFPLQNHLMRPFPGRACPQNQQIYNYRLSRARRIVENAYGILAARWRVYHTELGIRPQLVNSIVKASYVRHNFVQGQSTPVQITTLLQETQDVPIEGLQDMNGAGNRAGNESIAIRNAFMDFFVNDSAVPWQQAHVNRGCFTN